MIVCMTTNSLKGYLQAKNFCLKLGQTLSSFAAY